MFKQKISEKVRLRQMVDQYCYRETIKLDENRVEDCQQQQGRKAIKTTLSCESYRDLATQKLEASEVDKATGTVKHIRILKREVDGADLYSLSESRFFKSVVELIEAASATSSPCRKAAESGKEGDAKGKISNQVGFFPNEYIEEE
ncbi:hypothetical protein TKK_0010181 [Trichogramma kaykai]